MATPFDDSQRMLSLAARLLCDFPGAVTAEDLKPLTDVGVSPDEAWRLCLAALCGLDVADDADDRAFYHRMFVPSLRVLDAAEHRADPYLQRIRFPGNVSGGTWTFRHQQYAPWEAFVCDDLRTLPDGRVLPQLGCFPTAFDYPAALENGRIYMTVTPNETATIRPEAARAFGHTVALGLGLGYFAFMALGNPRVTHVTVVERSADVIELFTRRLLPQFPRPECLTLIHADAFDWMRDQLSRIRPDFLFGDLWHDVSDGLPLWQELQGFEPLSPQTVYAYWIEKTLRCYV